MTQEQTFYLTRKGVFLAKIPPRAKSSKKCINDAYSAENDAIARPMPHILALPKENFSRDPGNKPPGMIIRAFSLLIIEFGEGRSLAPGLF
jgi:hypothetical protein